MYQIPFCLFRGHKSLVIFFLQFFFEEDFQDVVDKVGKELQIVATETVREEKIQPKKNLMRKLRQFYLFIYLLTVISSGLSLERVTLWQILRNFDKSGTIPPEYSCPSSSR